MKMRRWRIGSRTRVRRPSHKTKLRYRIVAWAFAVLFVVSNIGQSVFADVAVTPNSGQDIIFTDYTPSSVPNEKYYNPERSAKIKIMYHAIGRCLLKSYPYHNNVNSPVQIQETELFYPNRKIINEKISFSSNDSYKDPGASAGWGGGSDVDYLDYVSGAWLDDIADDGNDDIIKCTDIGRTDRSSKNLLDEFVKELFPNGLPNGGGAATQLNALICNPGMNIYSGSDGLFTTSGKNIPPNDAGCIKQTYIPNGGGQERNRTYTIRGFTAEGSAKDKRSYAMKYIADLINYALPSNTTGVRFNYDDVVAGKFTVAEQYYLAKNTMLDGSCKKGDEWSVLKFSDPPDTSPINGVGSFIANNQVSLVNKIIMIDKTDNKTDINGVLNWRNDNVWMDMNGNGDQDWKIDNNKQIWEIEKNDDPKSGPSSVPGHDIKCSDLVKIFEGLVDGPYVKEDSVPIRSPYVAAVYQLYANLVAADCTTQWEDKVGKKYNDLKEELTGYVKGYDSDTTYTLSDGTTEYRPKELRPGESLPDGKKLYMFKETIAKDVYVEGNNITSYSKRSIEWWDAQNKYLATLENEGGAAAGVNNNGLLVGLGTRILQIGAQGTLKCNIKDYTPTDIPENATDPEDQIPTGSGTSCDGGSLGWVLCPVIDALSGSVNMFMNWIENNLSNNILLSNEVTSDKTGSELIKQAWDRILPIANIGFAIAFLIVIYSAATSTGLKNYDVKKILPRLVIAAILVNISFWLCALISDLVNILGANIKTFIENAVGLNTGDNNSFGSSDWADTIGGISVTIVGLGSAILLITYLAPLFLAFLLIVALLQFRTIAITGLIIVSPIALVLWLLPNTKKWFDKWLKEYVRLLFVYPMIMAVWGLTRFATAIMTNVDTTDGTWDNLVKYAGTLIIQVMPAVAIIPIFKMGGSLMGKFQGLAQKGIDKTIAKPVKSIGDRGKALAANGLRKVAGDRGEAELRDGKWVNSKTKRRIIDTRALNAQNKKIEEADKQINAIKGFGDMKKDRATVLNNARKNAKYKDMGDDELATALASDLSAANTAKRLATDKLDAVKFKKGGYGAFGFRDTAGILGGFIAGSGSFSKRGEDKLKNAQANSTGTQKLDRLNLDLKNSAQTFKTELEKQDYELRLKAREESIQHLAQMMARKAESETGVAGINYRTASAAADLQPSNADILAQKSSQQAKITENMNRLFEESAFVEDGQGNVIDRINQMRSAINDGKGKIDFRGMNYKDANGNAIDEIDMQSFKEGKYDKQINKFMQSQIEQQIASAMNADDILNIYKMVKPEDTIGGFNAIDGFNINNFNNSTDIQFARMQSREKAAAGGNQTLIGIIATREEDYKNARGLANTGSSQTGGNQP